MAQEKANVVTKEVPAKRAGKKTAVNKKAVAKKQALKKAVSKKAATRKAPAKKATTRSVLQGKANAAADALEKLAHRYSFNGLDSAIESARKMIADNEKLLVRLEKQVDKAMQSVAKADKTLADRREAARSSRFDTLAFWRAECCLNCLQCHLRGFPKAEHCLSSSSRVLWFF